MDSFILLNHLMIRKLEYRCNKILLPLDRHNKNETELKTFLCMDNKNQMRPVFFPHEYDLQFKKTDFFLSLK